MEALKRITFFKGIELFKPLDCFIPSSSATFPGKRPIFPQSHDEEIEIPLGFFAVLFHFDDEKFVSVNERLQIAMPSEGEETVHDFNCVDLDDYSFFYFFLTAQELTDAEFDVMRSPGCNYWNPEALRWEPRGHVLENCWENHHFYNVSDGFFPVCYTLQGDLTFAAKHADLPIFTFERLSTALSFKQFFGDSNYSQLSDRENAYFFIELSLDDLRAAGVVVPEDLTGFNFNPVSAQFEAVDKPGPDFGWDSITLRWMPFCTSCASRKLAFDWEKDSDWMQTKVEVHCYDGGAREVMKQLFSRQFGSYCDCNCLCENCGSFDYPWEISSHRLLDGDSNVLSLWTCD